MREIEKMNAKQREQVEQMKRERMKLTSPIDRVAFDNGSDGRSFTLHMVAALETFRDSEGNTWRAVDGTPFLEDEHGERFSRAWVEQHFGPLK